MLSKRELNLYFFLAKQRFALYLKLAPQLRSWSRKRVARYHNNIKMHSLCTHSFFPIKTCPEVLRMESHVILRYNTPLHKLFLSNLPVPEEWNHMSSTAHRDVLALSKENEDFHLRKIPDWMHLPNNNEWRWRKLRVKLKQIYF